MDPNQYKFLQENKYKRYTGTNCSYNILGRANTALIIEIKTRNNPNIQEPQNNVWYTHMINYDTAMKIHKYYYTQHNKEQRKPHPIYIYIYVYIASSESDKINIWYWNFSQQLPLERRVEGAIWKRHKEVSEVLVMVYILICVMVTQECLLCDKSLSCTLMISAFLCTYVILHFKAYFMLRWTNQPPPCLSH